MTSTFDAWAISVITEVTHDVISNTNVPDNYYGMEPTRHFQRQSVETIRHSQAELPLRPAQVMTAVKWLFKSHRLQFVQGNERRQDKSYIPQYHGSLKHFGKSGIVLFTLCHLASLGKRQRASRKLGRDERCYSTFVSFAMNIYDQRSCLPWTGARGS